MMYQVKELHNTMHIEIPFKNGINLCTNMFFICPLPSYFFYFYMPRAIRGLE